MVYKWFINNDIVRKRACKSIHACTYAVLGLLLLNACHSTRRTANVAPAPPTSVVAADTTVLPTFPAEVLYVIGLEWETIHDSASAKYNTQEAAIIRADSMAFGDYMEQRLLQLYPERAYPGYVSKVERLAEALIYAHTRGRGIANNIQSELPDALSYYGRPSANGTTQIGALWGDSTTNSDEVSFMEMTVKEQARLDTLRTIAAQNTWADRAQFDSLAPSMIEEENLGLTLLLWRGPRLFYRIMQSKARAEHLARYYYGEETSNGKRGDAFKHTYVNALLRTYVGIPITYLVMDLYWEQMHPNAPCDRYMDLHNNVVGRRSKYKDFIYSEDDGTPAWQQWAAHIHQYIEDTTQNASYRPWNKETPSFIVVPQAEEVDRHNYIYWDNGTAE